MNGGYEYIYGRIKYSKIDKRNEFYYDNSDAIIYVSDKIRIS